MFKCFRGWISIPLFVGIVAILVFVLNYNYTVAPFGQSPVSQIVLSSSIKGCAETDQGLATRGLNDDKLKDPAIEVIDGRLSYSRAINHTCCRKVEVQKNIEDSVINISEVWSGPSCRCICFSEISAILANIPAGNYTVNIFETGTQSDGTQMEAKLIITNEVNI